MLKIRGMSIAENLLMGVNRFGHCLTLRLSCGALGTPLGSRQLQPVVRPLPVSEEPSEALARSARPRKSLAMTDMEHPACSPEVSVPRSSTREDAQRWSYAMALDSEKTPAVHSS